jgi:hypothetical protein
MSSETKKQTDKDLISQYLDQRKNFVIEVNGHLYRTRYGHHAAMVLVPYVADVFFFEDEFADLHLGVVSLVLPGSVQIRAVPRAKWATQPPFRHQTITFTITYKQLLCKLIEDKK